MNQQIAIGTVVLLGVFYCWTSRINARFFFGRTASPDLKTSPEGRALTRQYLIGTLLLTAIAAVAAWAGVRSGIRPLGAGGLLVEIVGFSLVFARANRQVGQLVAEHANAGEVQVRQVDLLEQPRYWVPGVIAVLTPLALCAATFVAVVLAEAHGAGIQAGLNIFGERADRLGESFVLGMAVGMMAAASAVLLIFRVSVRLRTRMAQYSIRSSYFMLWAGTALTIATLGSNDLGFAMSRSFGKSLVAVALTATVIMMIWNQARSKHFVPPPVELGSDERWRWGLFYLDRNDPALFVQSRCGAGYTLNYGRVAAWPITLGALAYVVAVLFFLPHHH